MKALIVDDEILARRRIVKLLNQIDEIELLGECADGESAINTINNEKPDLIFLDISMKDMNGFEVLQNIEFNPKPIVVFVTAYDKYALQAFDAEAFDFLHKPYKEERFFKTVSRVLQTSKSEANANFEKRLEDLFSLYSKLNSNKITPHNIPVKIGNKTVLISVSQIQYIIASGYYVEIYVGDKKYLHRESLNSLSEQLEDDLFFRVHRSAIINLKEIQAIEHSDFGEIDVRMKDNKLIRVSKSHKKDLLLKLGL